MQKWALPDKSPVDVLILISLAGNSRDFRALDELVSEGGAVGRVYLIYGIYLGMFQTRDAEDLVIQC